MCVCKRLTIIISSKTPIWSERITFMKNLPNDFKTTFKFTNSLSSYIWGGSYYFVLLKGIKSRSKSCLLPTTNSWLSQLLSKIKNSTKIIASHLLEDGHAFRISLEMEIGGTKIIWPHGICCLKQIGIQLKLLCPLYI